MNRIIMGIQIDKREEEATAVQNLLTKHGCIIRTRLGLHDSDGACSSHGLVLIDFIEEKENEIDILKSELEAISGVVVKTMTF